MPHLLLCLCTTSRMVLDCVKVALAGYEPLIDWFQKVGSTEISAPVPTPAPVFSQSPDADLCLGL